MRNFLFTIFLIPFLSFSQYGILDETFGDGGIVNYTIPLESSYVLNMEIDSQGNIYVLGQYEQYNNVIGHFTTRVFISKLNENGSIDTSFGNEGYVTYEMPDGWLVAYGFKIIDSKLSAITKKLN